MEGKIKRYLPIGIFILCFLLIMSFWLGRQTRGAQAAVPKPLPEAEYQTVAQPININTASVKELTELPEIGEKTAKAIVDYREENGPFATIWDLESVAGIGESKMESLEPYVTVS